MTAPTNVDIGSLIETRAGFRGGRPVLSGTGTHVHALAAHYRHGLTVEEIADEYPHLARAQVYAAIAYYLANAAEIEGYLEADSELYDELSARAEGQSLARRPAGR